MNQSGPLCQNAYARAEDHSAHILNHVTKTKMQDPPFPTVEKRAHDGPDDHFRALPPIITSSSSPIRKQPSTPPSPLSPISPSYRRAGSTHDPFAATSKADLLQHPSFGRQLPCAKHTSKLRTKCSLFNGLNPFKDNEGRQEGSSVGPAKPWLRQRNTAGDMCARSGRAGGRGGSQSGSSISDDNRDCILSDLFVDSSEDAPTSDDHLEAVPWSAPSSDVDSATDMTGVQRLGVHSDVFREQGSPKTGRRLTNGHVPSGVKRQSISRSSSVTDPFGAFQPRSGSAMLYAYDHRHSVYRADGSLRTQPVSQRRRLTESSPKKMASAQPTWQAGDRSDSDEEGIAELVKSAVTSFASDVGARSPHAAMAYLWHKVVESVWDSGDAKIDVSDRGVTSIHPVIADLSNFVAIDPPRSFEPTTSKRSLPSRVGSFQRQPSSRHTPGRTVTSGNAFYAASSPLHSGAVGSPGSSQRSAETVRGAGKGKLQLYLAGNRLTKLPSALFEVGNLRVLSLRKNNLTALPAAIGDLQNLRELNIANNDLRYLPAEIQKLSLDQFAHFPNRFLLPPAEAKVETRALYTITGAVLASQASPFEDDDSHGQDHADDMADALIASTKSDMKSCLEGGSTSTPLLGSHPFAGDVAMGSSPLPARLQPIGGSAGIWRPATSTEQGRSLRGTFDRTRSNLQFCDPLSRGGGNMLGTTGGHRVGNSEPHTAATSSLSSSSLGQTSALNNDGDESMDSGELSSATAMQAYVGATPKKEGQAPHRPTESDPLAVGIRVARILGPLKRTTTSSLPSLRELCVRRLLSPCEASQYPSPSSDPDDSNATVTDPGPSDTRTTRGQPRSVMWARVPSSSSAYQFRYHSGRRPLCLLESYENGALRDLETGAQMEAGTIKMLEAARRSMEGKWGSGNGISGLHSMPASAATAMREARSLGDSWCKGVAGSGFEASSAHDRIATARLKPSLEDDESDADSSSPASEGGTDRGEAGQGPHICQSSAGGNVASPLWQRSALAPVLDIPCQLDTQGDDCAVNPYFNRCPNPCHASTHALSASAGIGDVGLGSGSGSMKPLTSATGSAIIDYPVRADKTMFAPLFEKAMEQRLEWVSHIGGIKVISGSVAAAGALGESDVAGCGFIPVLWRGCGRGCLDFLDAA